MPLDSWKEMCSEHSSAYLTEIQKMESNWVQLTEMPKEKGLDYSLAHPMAMQMVGLLDSLTEIANLTDYNLVLRWAMY
eukprot:scaffold5189_cov131-Skeletonema_marinoi.AAC.4